MGSTEQVAGRDLRARFGRGQMPGETADDFQPPGGVEPIDAGSRSGPS